MILHLNIKKFAFKKLLSNKNVDSMALTVKIKVVIADILLTYAVIWAIWPEFNIYIYGKKKSIYQNFILDYPTVTHDD
jgi:hypothetical protein